LKKPLGVVNEWRDVAGSVCVVADHVGTSFVNTDATPHIAVEAVELKIYVNISCLTIVMV